jgi:hypothetical protein
MPQKQSEHYYSNVKHNDKLQSAQKTACVKICVVQWKQMHFLEEKYILLLLFHVKYLYRMSLKRLKVWHLINKP